MATAPASTLWRRFVLTLEMIKFEHSVFALPFALTGALLAWRDSGYLIAGLALRLGFIVLAMVGARSAAMTFNRLLDADIDARNPRTKMRHLPAGMSRRGFAFAFLFASLRRLCPRRRHARAAVPEALSRGSRRGPDLLLDQAIHLAVAPCAGLALGIAPAAAWIAVRGALDWRICWLTAAVTLLDRRIRHHLRLPGLRIRLRRGALLHARAIWASAARCGSRGPSTWR